MGRKAELEVKIPSLFRCPISLDVMRSPVSLSTGVTYDRSSIQRWLDTGHATCPATMQPLASTDLVPNLTLRRLIRLWSSTASPSAAAVDAHSLRRLAAFFSDTDADESAKASLAAADAFAPALSSALADPTTADPAAHLLAEILTADYIDSETKKIVRSAVADDTSISCLIGVMKRRSTSSTAAASVIAVLLEESKALVRDKLDDLLPELIRMIDAGPDRGAAVACLAAVAAAERKARARMVEMGAVAALGRMLAAPPEAAPARVAEAAMRLIDAAAGSAEGREAVGEIAGAIVGRMMKVGREGRESAVSALWSVCCLLGDRRAAAAAIAGAGFTKVLLTMQSGCSPAARRMCGDLIRAFRANSKGCVLGYETRTTHIMPF